MRALNLDELENKIESDVSDIIYTEKKFVTYKVTQFLYFLHSQEISKRILERINEDFFYLKENLPPSNYTFIDSKQKDLVLSDIKCREEQGAFGYFVIQQFYEVEKKHENHYIEIASRWYRLGGDFIQQNENFKEYFFKPFIDLLQWYIYEGKVKNERDYFSKHEIKEIYNKLDKMSEEMSNFNLRREHGQEVIFNEINELKELIKFLNKKNWQEIVKGKLGDLVIGTIISSDNAKSIFDSLIDSKIVPSLGL